MGRGVDVLKREEWRKRFQRFSQLGLTVAEFCQWEGVSVATFYNWRRKCESHPDGWDRETRLTVSPRLAKSSFLPVCLASARELSATSIPGDLEWQAPTSARMEILLTNGVRILVTANDTAAMQEAIIAAGLILPVTEHAAC